MRFPGKTPHLKGYFTTNSKVMNKIWPSACHLRYWQSPVEMVFTYVENNLSCIWMTCVGWRCLNVFTVSQVYNLRGTNTCHIFILITLMVFKYNQITFIVVNLWNILVSLFSEVMFSYSFSDYCSPSCFSCVLSSHFVVFLLFSSYILLSELSY